MANERCIAALGVISVVLTACSGEEAGLSQPANGIDPSGSASGSGSGSGFGNAPGGGGSVVAPGFGGSPAAGGASNMVAGVGTAGSGGASSIPAEGAAGAGGADGSPPVSSDCTPGIPATSQIPRLSRRQYDAVIRDLLDITVLASDGNNPPSAGLYADFDGPMNVDAWRLYQETAAKISAEVMAGPSRSLFIDCDPAVTGCLTETIQTFGQKAFRRPLTPEEVARFELLSQTTPPGTPEEVAETTLYAFLVSPSFLQITELSSEEEGDAIKLSPYEVAARLSFVLWGSLPDDTLRVAADMGELATKDQILAQAERMIGVRDKTAPLVSAYHRTYLDMDNDGSHWWKVSHDTTKFPHYSDALVPALRLELDRFFEELTFAGGSFADLFLSNVGFVNEDTAAIYGLDPASYGEELTQVELDLAQRPGFLTRAGFLSSFSHFDSTSPILRGAYITINVIGINPGEPDPEFFLTPPPPGPHYTERAYVEALTSQDACTSCHTPFINPPGFVLENYDATGKWQTVDPRSADDPTLGAIDSTATVTFSADNVKEISSPRELMEEISKTPLAKRLYAQEWVSFTTGRQPNPNDTCTVDLIDMKLSQGGYTILDLLADLTQTDSFRLRVREN
jgi:hypothetical protein